MKKRFFRMFLMIAGVLTVMVILLSQSLYLPGESNHATKKTEHAPSSAIIQAPSDVVTSPSVELDEMVPPAEHTVAEHEPAKKHFAPVARILTPYFNILFRSIISPNAP